MVFHVLSLSLSLSLNGQRIKINLTSNERIIHAIPEADIINNNCASFAQSEFKQNYLFE